MKMHKWSVWGLSIAFQLLLGVQVFGQLHLPKDPDFLATLSAVGYDADGEATLIAGNGYFQVLFSGGETTDWIQTKLENITAILYYDANSTIFFNGAEFTMLDKANQSYSEPVLWPGLPSSWNNQVTAATNWYQGKILFVNGSEYCTLDPQTESYGNVQSLSSLSGWEASWGNQVKAAWKEGDTVFFLIGSTIVAYDMIKQAFGPFRAKQSGLIPKRNSGSSNPSLASSSASPSNPGTASAMSPALMNSATPAPSSEGWNNYDPEVDGMFRTDYPDYEKGSFTADKAFSGNTKVPGYDWLGAGINITRFNPIFPTNSWTATNSPIVTTLSPKTGGNRGRDVLPWGCNSRTTSSGVGSFSSKWVTSFTEFVNTFKLGGGASVGVGRSGNQIAGADFSGSFFELMSEKTGSEVIYHVERVNRSVFNLSMDLFWRNAEYGRCRQKLSTGFEDAIEALPANPSQEQCSAIIEEYGTHIATGLTMGGVHLVLTEIQKNDFASTRMTETAFKASASGSIKKVKVGANVEMQTSTSNTEGGSVKTFDRKTHAVGGFGHESSERWAEELAEDPVAISITMVPLSQ
ncbi:MAG: MAC/perforin domain-containing protein, partial [Bacteroidota bacterium]